MPVSSDRPSARYPLHVTISIAFAGILLLFGAALIAFNYVESRKVALLGADEQLERIGAHLQSSVTELYGPAQSLVDISSRALTPDHLTLEQRLRSLTYLAEALRVNHRISSIYVGYEDGDFLQVRDAKHPHVERAGFDIPPGTGFIVRYIDRPSAGPVEERHVFVDHQLALIDRDVVEWTGLDPRKRGWYRSAISQFEQSVSEAYAFFTTGEIGVTIARRLAAGHGVVGVDITLRDLSDGLSEHHITPSSRIVMFEPNGHVIALSDRRLDLRVDAGRPNEPVNLPHVSELNDPVYDGLAELLVEGIPTTRIELTVDDRVWLVGFASLPVKAAEPVVLASLVPRDELLVGVTRVRDQSALISLGLMVAALILVVGVSMHVSRSLRKLAREAQEIRELRLDSPLTVTSRIEEVDDLATTMAAMKSSLQQFLEISRALSAEKQFNRLLIRVLDEARRVSGAEGGAILLRSEEMQQLDVAILQGAVGAPGSEVEVSLPPVSLESDGGQNDRSIDRATVHTGSTLRIDDATSDERYDLRGVRQRFESVGCTTKALLSVPLRNQQDMVIGVLQLINPRGSRDDAIQFRDGAIPYIEALSSNAAVALDNRRLLKAQKDLLESFIHVVAGAIDAKSHYTHGHCQRVPVLARMLAEAAHDSECQPFADFSLSDDERYELHLASWLHDCGKVTTPEYVVDKATKLETIYNRIHEIRMRFELLLLDAEIEYHEACRAGTEDEATLRRRLIERQAEIREDFAFVAECNRGGEFMSDERIERLRSIAAQEWIRQLDDRLGLSQEELQRFEGQPAPTLPRAESLLADKPEQILPRPDGDDPLVDDPHGFRVDVPQHLYNRGELHNLSIRRGTLTAEERFKINEHIMETIRMLGRLPFPRELRRVPAWAGNHHEKLDGTGYPRRLVADQLSVPDRIMAIADIFEALTATDRPYMHPKKLSQAIGIMGSMCESGHICPQLFGLFLESGVHRRYAEQFLQPEQVDDVDVHAILGNDSGAARFAS